MGKSWWIAGLLLVVACSDGGAGQQDTSDLDVSISDVSVSDVEPYSGECGAEYEVLAEGDKVSGSTVSSYDMKNFEDECRGNVGCSDWVPGPECGDGDRLSCMRCFNEHCIDAEYVFECHAPPLVEPEEVVEDVSELEDTAQDMPETGDMAPDTTEAEDTAPEEEAPDLPPETVGCPEGGDLATLRACPQGDFTPPFELTPVTVTYRYSEGFFVADQSAAIWIYTSASPDWPLPELGQVITLSVEKLSEWEGTLEVTRAGAPSLVDDVGLAGVAAVGLDLGLLDGAALGEEHEARRARAVGATVTTGAGTAWTLQAGGADHAWQVDEPGALCVGAQLELKAAVVLQAGDDHRLQSYNLAADVTGLDTSACQGPDTSNWGFELNDPGDPPPGFEKATDFFTATRSTDQAHAGAASCALTWHNNANQDLYQALWVPVTPEQAVSFSVWVLDGDDDGRLRPVLDFYDAQKGSLGKVYGDLFSVDQPAAWQELTVEAQAPESAAWARGFVRLHDVGGGTDGSATLFIDVWAMPLAGE
jgi:hypothetical protein